MGAYAPSAPQFCRLCLYFFIRHASLWHGSIITNLAVIETQYGKLYKGLSDGQIESLVPDIAKMKQVRFHLHWSILNQQVWRCLLPDLQGQLSDTPQKIVPTALETPRSVLHPSGLPVAFQNTFEPSQGNVCIILCNVTSFVASPTNLCYLHGLTYYQLDFFCTIG